VFTPGDRERLRHRLLERAAADPRLSAGAVTGSRAEGREDRWSDIDLFFGVQGPVETTLEEWTAFAYDELAAVHHFELRSGPATYRAFLLPNALQVDLGFTPAESFGPAGDGAFDVVFGTAGARQPRPPDVGFLVGMGWHHVLHVRSAIERGRPWRAEHWLSALRDVVLSLASIRHALPHSYAQRRRPAGGGHRRNPANPGARPGAGDPHRRTRRRDDGAARRAPARRRAAGRPAGSAPERVNTGTDPSVTKRRRYG
jgi:hypothetical protein